MPPLTTDEKRLLLRLARQSLESFVLRQPIRSSPGLLSGSAADAPSQFSSRLRESGWVFVSLHTHSPREQLLRGCIGWMEALEPLWQAVQEAARAAASRDPRFPPVRPEELPQLRLEISVLSPAQPVQPHQIEIGVHGLIVSMGAIRGLLLPQVAEQHHWKREQFLEQTCRKAGLPADAWQHGARLEAFTADIFSED